MGFFEWVGWLIIVALGSAFISGGLTSIGEGLSSIADAMRKQNDKQNDKDNKLLNK